MKKSLRVWVVAAVAVAATSAIGFAQSEGSHWTEQRFAKRVIARIEAKLNVTEAQREEAKNVLKAEEPTIVALAAQAKLERDAMTQLRMMERGISAHALTHLFELFYRSGETSAMHPEGTGFGLAIAQRIVTMHGGTIRAANVIPHGLELKIALPLADLKDA